MYFFMLFSISLIPLVLFIFLYVIEKTRMTRPLLMFLILLFIWNVDVVVLFAEGILSEQTILLLFKIFRFGSIMFMPLVYYYILYIFKTFNVPLGRWKFILNRKVFIGFFIYSVVVYAVNLTEYGLNGLTLIENTKFFPSYYYPIYAKWNILYFINVIFVFIHTFLLLFLTTKLEKSYFRTFSIYLVISILLVFINGALSGFNVFPLPVSILNAVFVTMIIFSAYFFINNQMVKKMNQELTNQRNFLQTILDSNPNYLFVKDLYGNYVVVNEAFANDFGSLLKHSRIDHPLKEQKGFNKQEFQTYEEIVTDDHNQKRNIEVTEIPFVNNDEDHLILYVANDITQRLKEEEYIRKSEKLNVLGELAAGVAHEIRNPLTSLKGFIHLIKSDDTEADKRNFYLDIMSKEIDRISEVINELLLLAKPQADVFEKTDILKVLKDVKVLLDTTAIMRNIEIHIESQEDLPKIEVIANQVKQVFINIIKNAIEAMTNGGKVHIIVKAMGDSKVNIQIIDNGIGISKDRLPKLGEPFFTTKEKGTGLGLTVCHRIVRRHHGEIHFESELGKGTTVNIILPIEQHRSA